MCRRGAWRDPDRRVRPGNHGPGRGFTPAVATTSDADLVPTRTRAAGIMRSKRQARGQACCVRPRRLNYIANGRDFHFRTCTLQYGTVRLGKTKLGTLPRFVHIKKKGPGLKTFRYAIKLVELYGVTKSFWKYVLI